eukprot:Ihof_evm14s37 gene=Ihof_evmTU14s37
MGSGLPLSAHILSSHLGKFNIYCDNEVYHDNQPLSGLVSAQLLGTFHCKAISVAVTCDMEYTKDDGSTGCVVLYQNEVLVWEGEGLHPGPQNIKFCLTMPAGLPPSSTWSSVGLGENQVLWHLVAMASATVEAQQVLVRLGTIVFRKATVYRPTPHLSPQARRGKPFLGASRSHQLYLFAELTRDVYYRGEVVQVTYRIHNESNRNVYEVHVMAVQKTKLSCEGVILREVACVLDHGEYVTGCPVKPNQVVANTVSLRLTSEQPDSIRAVGPGSQVAAIDEQIEPVSNRLSATIDYREPPLPSIQHPTVLEVSYDVVVRCVLWGGSFLEVKVPFCLSDVVHNPA